MQEEIEDAMMISFEIIATIGNKGFRQYIEVSPSEFKDFDKIADSHYSNVKMKLLSEVFSKYPSIWYNNTPLDTTVLQNIII